MYSIWAITCWPFLSALQMMYPGSGCLESSYQAAFPIRSRGTLSFFRLWTCRYSLGSVFCAGIMCAMLPGSLLLVTSMGVVMFLSFLFRRVFLCYDTTGSPSQQESGGACVILRMTLSRADLVLVRLFRVRSVRQRKAVFPWLLNNSLKGLILKQEIEDREERGMRIGLQYD